MHVPPGTGDLAAVPVQRATHRRPADLGGADGPSVMVNADDLAAMLRTLVPSAADIDYSPGRWTLRCFGGEVTASAANLEELGARAVEGLRELVGKADPHRAAPLVWLVQLSSDHDLRAWLHLPGAATAE